MVFFSC